MSDATSTFSHQRTVGLAFGVLIILLYVFLMAPLVMIIGASFTESLLIEFPPQGFSLQWYFEFFNRQDLVEGLLMSLRIGAITAIVTTTVAMMAALAGQVIAGRLSGWFQLGMTLPLLVPELLTAVGLLFFLYKIELGRTVIGGLAFGTIATLVLVPVFFAALHGWMARRAHSDNHPIPHESLA